MVAAWKSDRLLWVGAVASAVALGADLLLVFAHLVGISGVWLSAVLGGASLAAVALGYRGLRDVVPGKFGVVLARVGLVVGVVAPLLHVLSAAVIGDALQQMAGAPVPPAVAFGPPVLQVLWFLLVTLALLGSVVFAVAVGQGSTRLPRPMAVMSPALLALLLLLLGVLTPRPDMMAVLSGNVAQMLFFVLVVITVRPATAP